MEHFSSNEFMFDFTDAKESFKNSVFRKSTFLYNINNLYYINKLNKLRRQSEIAIIYLLLKNKHLVNKIVNNDAVSENIDPHQNRQMYQGQHSVKDILG